MTFQMGLGALLKFKKMLAALQARDYTSARTEALDSAWAKQTPQRAKRVTDLFKED
jgi:lysozyme